MSEKAKDVLHVRSQQIMASAELLAQQTSDWQVIQAYVSGRLLDLQLTAIQEEKLGRYQFSYNQMVSGKYTDAEVCEMIMHQYGLSYVQALQDLRDAKEIFSSSININKQFEIRMRIELNKRSMQMAIAAGDLRAYAQIEKNGVKLAELLPDAEDAAADNFEPHTNVFKFDPASLGYSDVTKQDLKQLFIDIEAKFPGRLDTSLLDIVDAEIVEES